MIAAHLPMLLATVYPAALILAIACAMEWHRLGQADADDTDAGYGVADYAPPADQPPATGRAPVRYRFVRPAAPEHAPAPALLPPPPPGTDPGVLEYHRLIAARWLRELGAEARTREAAAR